MVKWIETTGRSEEDAISAALFQLGLDRDDVSVEVLERGAELSLCRHLETGRVLEVLTEYLYVDRGVTRCEDSTDYRLAVRPGDTLSVVRRISDRALVKKDGVTGWYFGRLAH